MLNECWVYFHFQRDHPFASKASEGEEDEEEKKEERAKPQVDPPGPPSQPLLIGSCSGFIETTVKIKQNDMLPGPKVCVALSCPVFQK